MALKALLTAIAAAAVGVGFILPAPPHHAWNPPSQIAQIELRP